MSSLKQLAADVLGDNAAVRIHALTTASFPEAGTMSDRMWQKPPVSRGQHHSERYSTLHERWPNLTICHDFSFRTVRAVLRRRLMPQCRVLLCVEQLPTDLRALHRVVLTGVDAVLVHSEAAARAVHAVGVPAARIVFSADRDDLAVFVQPARLRTGLDVHRVIYVGDLEPEAGVADFLSCVTAWGERNPHRAIEIVWAGEGCLRGVLEAQLVPANVLQRFPGRLGRDKLAATFLDCDILAVPALSDSWDSVVLEALTAGLPVLGSDRARAVVDLITHGLTGWVFNPFEAGAMTGAVDVALNTRPDELDRMRARVAARSAPALPKLDARICRALRLEAAGPPLDTTSLGLVP